MQTHNAQSLGEQSPAEGESAEPIAAFVERFRQAWAAPNLDLHERLWADDVCLIQPMMGTVVGRTACRKAFAQMFVLLPDIHAEVHRWSGTETELFIEIGLTATFGGREVRWSATDRFLLRDGLIVERRSYFDSQPLLMMMLRRPRGWPNVIKSGFRPRFDVDLSRRASYASATPAAATAETTPATTR